MYRGQHPRQYDRGHLVPSRTYSSSQERCDSTYTYTNAVPQEKSWNRGVWSKFERRIRRYAKETCTAGQFPGVLFLLTGTSFARIGKLKGKIQRIPDSVPLKYFKEIAIPKSLWTAGCCVRQKGISESFAVMGNNVRKYNWQSFTRQITVAELQKILTFDVSTYHNIGGPNVDLFPGDPDCAKNNMGNLPSPGPGR